MSDPSEKTRSAVVVLVGPVYIVENIGIPPTNPGHADSVHCHPCPQNCVQLYLDLHMRVDSLRPSYYGKARDSSRISNLLQGN